MRIAELGEFGLIERIARLTGEPRGAVVGIGDDAAVLDTGGPRLVLATIDIQVEGRHFVKERTTARELGRRTAAINLSDIGAMGGEPRWALVSLALPPDLDVGWVDDLYAGLTEELGGYGAAVIGGNLSSSDSIVLDLALLGEVERGRVLTRGGARPGDAVFVTGSLGASAAGRAALDMALDASYPATAACIRAHLTPTPRVREGAAIAATGLATAMLDLSDGLSSDIGHLCDQSGVGVALNIGALPISAQARAVASWLKLRPLELAVAGGEDYELLFTAPPEAEAALVAAVRAVSSTLVTCIGLILPAADGRWLSDGLASQPLTAGGWDHFRE